MVQQTDAIGIAALDPDQEILQHRKVVPLSSLRHKASDNLSKAWTSPSNNPIQVSGLKIVVVAWNACCTTSS